MKKRIKILKDILRELGDHIVRLQTRVGISFVDDDDTSI